MPGQQGVKGSASTQNGGHSVLTSHDARLVVGSNPLWSREVDVGLGDLKGGPEEKTAKEMSGALEKMTEVTDYIIV